MPTPAVFVWLPGTQDADRCRREALVASLVEQFRG
jgi:hypothetical protein